MQLKLFVTNPALETHCSVAFVYGDGDDLIMPMHTLGHALAGCTGQSSVPKLAHLTALCPIPIYQYALLPIHALSGVIGLPNSSVKPCNLLILIDELAQAAFGPKCLDASLFQSNIVKKRSDD